VPLSAPVGWPLSPASHYAARVPQSELPDQLLRAITDMRGLPVAPTEKGFGVIASGTGPERGSLTGSPEVSAAALADSQPDVFGTQFTMPLLVLRDSALRHNAKAMAEWCTRAGVCLAPHGKTTMAPQLFARQLDEGAWGITAATISQVQTYRAFGVQRIFLANELTDRNGIAWLAAELSASPDWDCYVYVDSIAGVRLLDENLRAAGASRRLPVLVELGFEGGRTGCRSVAEALAVAAAAAQAPALVLAGASGYEGGIGRNPRDASPATLDAVAAFCADLRSLASQLPGTPPSGHPWIVSAGGSAYFDVVARELTASQPGDREVIVLLRSGCYITHDHGTYMEVGPGSSRGGPALIPAMEVWTNVLSRPESDLALACAGRRDVSFDGGFPVPIAVRKADGALADASQLTVTRLDDQHAYLQVPAAFDLGPGDLVCLGISHPCTTFDKWRVIPVVDDDYKVIDVVRTYF
jgi:D-serine deaminase-like pyridoxal phosphate-dependent protein